MEEIERRIRECFTYNGSTNITDNPKVMEDLVKLCRDTFRAGAREAVDRGWRLEDLEEVFKD